MGQPPRRRYDITSRAAAAARTRDEILRAAFALWHDHPYDDVSIKRIADAAGVSAQTVTLHFGGKSELLAAVWAWHAPRESELRAVPSADPVEAARVICGRYEELGPATLRLQAIEERVPVARELLEAGRVGHHAWVEATFGPRLPVAAPERVVALAALTAAYDLGTWQVLRRSLDPQGCEQAMALLALGVLSTLRPEKA